MRSLWNRARQLVSGFRRRTERLPLAVDELPPGYYYSPGHRVGDYRHADDVLRLLYRDSGPEASGPRPGYGESVGLGPFARSVPGYGDGDWVYNFDPYPQEPAGYSHATLGGRTVTASIDCE